MCQMCQPGMFQTVAFGRQVCRECESGIQPLRGQQQCIACPPVGVECHTRTRIEVQPGFFLAAIPNSTNSSGLSVWQCPLAAACLGGSQPGQLSCAEGHEDALCGKCMAGFYRGRLKCMACSASGTGDEVRQSMSLAGAGAFIIAAASATYLIKATHAPTTPQELSQHCRQLRLAWRALISHSSLAANILRIVLGYVQCLCVFRSFLRVRFPPVFDGFVAYLEMLSPDLLRLVGFRCVLPDGLSYQVELLTALVLPFVPILALLLLALAVVRCTPIWSQVVGVRTLLRAILTWPQVWDLGWWSFLLMYPTLSRQTLAMFDCVEYADSQVLRTQTDVRCYSATWLPWAVVALTGSAVYCFGAPVGIIMAVRQSEKGSRSVKRLTQVLMTTYRPRHAHWEGVDLLRKFVLTGVITLVEPQTRVQLWFGAVSSIFFLMLHLRFQPFKSVFCNILQAAALLQLLFTYLTANLFFVDITQPHEPHGRLYLGWSLVLGNSLAFLLIFMSSIHGMLRMRQDLYQWRLTWDDGCTPVMLSPPEKPEGYHLFLSHVWKYGQDQAGTIKSSIVSLVPTCKVFLDVDDLEDVSLLEDYIQQTDVVVVLVTEGYISSWNCRRELCAMFKQTKPIVCVLESDPDKGGTSVAQLRGELDALQRSGAGLPSDHESACQQFIQTVEQCTADQARSIPRSVEWHRERVLKAVALRVIVANVLQHQMRTLDEAHVAPCDLSSSESSSVCADTAQQEASRATQDANRASQELNKARRSRGTRLAKADASSKQRRKLVITHPLQLQVHEEKQALLRIEWPAQAVHLDAGYRAISGTQPDRSVFDEMRDRLSVLNIFVSDSPLAVRAGLPTIVLLCPGFFEQPALVQLLASTVQDALPEPPVARQPKLARGNAWRNELQHRVGRVHTTRRKDAHAHGSGAGRVSRTSSGGAHEVRTLAKRAQSIVQRRLSATAPAGQRLCLFSTERAFAFYIAQCRHYAPHLLDAGVFNSFFQKWPPSPLLQFAVAANQLHPLLPPPPSTKIMEELRRGSSSEVPLPVPVPVSCIPGSEYPPKEPAESLDAVTCATEADEETTPALPWTWRKRKLTERRSVQGKDSSRQSRLFGSRGANEMKEPSTSTRAQQHEGTEMSEASYQVTNESLNLRASQAQACPPPPGASMETRDAEEPRVDVTAVDESLQMNGRGSLVHRESTLFFLPVVSTTSSAGTETHAC